MSPSKSSAQVIAAQSRASLSARVAELLAASRDRVRLREHAGLALVLVTAALLYTPALFGWFQTDDFRFLNGPHQAGFADYLRDLFDFRHAPPPPEVPFYRPLYSTALLILYRLFGMHPAPYHIWSLVLHLANAALVWSISRRLTGRPAVAVMAAGVFALHPAYVTAVAWIDNINALMASAAALFSFWCFLRAEERRGQSYWYGLSAASYGASLLLHPEAGTMIVVLFAYRLLYSSPTTRWRRSLIFAPFVASAIAYFAVHRWMLHNHFLTEADEFRITGHMLRVYLTYFSSSIYPITTLEHVAWSPHQLIFSFAMTGIIATLLFRAVARRDRVAALAVLWYLVALFPISTAVYTSPLGELIDTRKLYAAGPALGLLLAVLVAPAIEAAIASPARSARVALATACIAAAMLAGSRVVKYENRIVSAEDEAHDFITALRAAHPELTPGTRLIVIGAPGSLAPFGYDAYIEALVNLYYHDVDVVPGAAPPPSQPGDIVFRYR